MPRPALPTPIKYCRHCGVQLERKTINGRLEDRGVFMRRLYCDRKCMALAMVKENCASPSHSRAKAHQQVKSACEVCGATGKLHVHHRDENPSNNSPLNLMTLCPSCHCLSHSPRTMADGVTLKPCAHCAMPSVKQGLCNTHLSRLKRHGHPLAKKRKTASGWILMYERGGSWFLTP